MDTPRGLESQGRAAFERAVAALVELGEDPAMSRDAVERYSRAVDMLATIRRAWVAHGRPALATGSKGQPVRHPLVAEIESQERHVLTLGEALLLTPASRSRAQRGGWRRGQARSPDRQPRRLRAVKDET